MNSTGISVWASAWSKSIGMADSCHFPFGKCYGECKFVLVGDAEHYLKAKAHALGSPVLVKAAEAFEKAVRDRR